MYNILNLHSYLECLGFDSRAGHTLFAWIWLFIAPRRVIEKVVDNWRGKHLNRLAWLVRPSPFTTIRAVELHSLVWEFHQLEYLSLRIFKSVEMTIIFYWQNTLCLKQRVNFLYQEFQPSQKNLWPLRKFWGNFLRKSHLVLFWCSKMVPWTA